jgi:hypothetical protein
LAGQDTPIRTYAGAEARRNDLCGSGSVAEIRRWTAHSAHHLDLAHEPLLSLLLRFSF